MENGLRTLEKVSGLSREKIQGIWEDVKENARKLNGCPGPHDFSIETTRGKALSKRWKCSKCGGEVSAVEKRWYCLGLEHGGHA